MYNIRYIKIILCILLGISLSSCKRNFQYSVLEVKPLANNLNNKAVERIHQLSPKDTFAFLVISDTQVAYDELEDFVKHANTISNDSIAFVLHGGDFTDYGANFEYNLYYDDIRKLKFPVVATIGNHDMLGNGREIFRRYFGDEDFTFEYGNTAFILFNSNSRELAFDGTLPDLNWLDSTIAKFTQKKNIIYLSHIEPMSYDFDQKKSKALAALFAQAPNSRLSIHGHNHTYNYYEPFEDGMKYLVASTLQKRSYVKVTVADTTVSVKELFY